MIEKAKECEINLGLQLLAINIASLETVIQRLETQLEPVLTPAPEKPATATALCAVSPMGVAIETATRSICSLEGRIATLLSNLAVSA